MDYFYKMAEQAQKDRKDRAIAAAEAEAPAAEAAVAELYLLQFGNMDTYPLFFL